MKYQKLFGLVIMTLFLHISCNQENLDNEQLSEKKVSLSEEESFEILNSQEVQEFTRIRFQFIDIVNAAMHNGYDIEYIRKLSLESISNKNSERRLLTILFGNEIIGKEYFDDFSNAESAIFNKYPELLQLSTSETVQCSNCVESGINIFFDNFKAISEYKLSIMDPQKLTLRGPTCGSYWNQVKLLVCAGVCSGITAGAGTVFCGWACWCTLCEESALAEIMC